MTMQFGTGLHLTHFTLNQVMLFFVSIVAIFILGAILTFWHSRKGKTKPPQLARLKENPILRPIPEHFWESEAVFNPAAVVSNGKVHLFYRALGHDGISRIGYAVSQDGIHFERFPSPVFSTETPAETRNHYLFTSPARLTYDTRTYASGGGWGGSEDPRAVKIGNRIFVTFNVFNGWDSIRVALTSIDEKDLSRKLWHWQHFLYLSEPYARNKNWILFPEKINGKYALFHNLHAKDPAHVEVKLIDEIEVSRPLPHFESVDPQHVPDRRIVWHDHTRSAGPPPIKTKKGWLLFYHAMDEERNRYKLGALLLDLNDPSKILHRSRTPVLEPDEWYENDWKPGIVYASGAVVLGDDLIVYYGGGDKYVAAAKVNLNEFLHKLIRHRPATLKPV